LLSRLCNQTHPTGIKFKGTFERRHFNRAKINKEKRLRRAKKETPAEDAER
jgi:hypothetical protein